MSSELAGQVVIHLGHDTGVSMNLRLAVGALAGLMTTVLLLPVLVISEEVRELIAVTANDILQQDPEYATTSSQLAIWLGTGLVLGVVFEGLVLTMEAVRPLVVIFADLVTLVDILAVIGVATLLTWRTRRAINATPSPDPQRSIRIATAVSLLYGLVLLAAISALHWLIFPI